ncbi:MAG: DNA-binding domain-containing protein [Symploca sp. SIO2E9]|nr:DNA-binding domain-containing protein [Symploca sp. SIO2E9]
MPPSLYNKLSDYMNRMGASKSEVIIAALVQYLGATEAVPLAQRVVELEERMEILEAEVKSN